MQQIYLDYNATTPIAKPVVDAMVPFLQGHYGNPSSSHAMGRAAKEAIEDARAKVASLLGCNPTEVVFTSGGTESNNLAIKGVIERGQVAGSHVIISAIEHPAVVEPVRYLEKLGCEVSVVGCDEQGVVNPNEVEKHILPNTRLVSVMHANNEVGTIQPIGQIAEICHGRGILLHTDASQSTGKIATAIDQLDCDLLTIAGHKLYAPKGVGVLYVRDGLELESHMHGASHEAGYRAGTENTPYIVAMGKAAELVVTNLDEASDALTGFRDRLSDALISAIPGLTINGQKAPRLPNTLSVSFPGVEGQALLKRIPEICASTGSACHSSGKVSSATLAAMGCSPEQMANTVRISVGWYTTSEQVERAANLIIDAWENLSTAIA